MASVTIFTRYPRPGRTKTRLIPLLGAEGAADLQRRMTLHTLRVARQVKDAEVVVRYTGGGLEEMSRLFGPSLPLIEQGEGDLGQRMFRSFVTHAESGTDRAVLIGSDCPGITAPLLQRAFDSLYTRDVVVGPAADGGYYLIGLRLDGPHGVPRSLFTGIAWGTSRVLGATVEAIHALKLRVHTLPVLHDVDTPRDLPAWRLNNSEVGVVVPTLNEEHHIHKTLRNPSRAHGVQLIVADGGSGDRTAEVARSLGARVVSCPRGRALQMNAGAEACDAGLLLFCHADTVLPDGFEEMVRQAMAHPHIAVGAFRFRLDASGSAYGRVERAVDWRCRYLHLPYGDQGLFMRRGTFERLRGFAPMRGMEDYDLVRRAKKLGCVVTLPAAAATGARKWKTQGITATTFQHQRMILKYWFG